MLDYTEMFDDDTGCDVMKDDKAYVEFSACINEYAQKIYDTELTNLEVRILLDKVTPFLEDLRL